MHKGAGIRGADIRDMRTRIIREVSKESSGYDVKNGPGGIKEIEFLAQYLQLRHIKKFPALIVYNTVLAIKRLAKYGILDIHLEESLLTCHRLLKTVDTILRLNEEDSVRADSEVPDIIKLFLNLESRDELSKKIEYARNRVIEIAGMFYGSLDN